MPNEIYPDLTNTKFDVKYARLKALSSDVMIRNPLGSGRGVGSESENVQEDPYVLPIASDTVLGGIMVGTGLSIDGDGVLSATGGGVTPAALTKTDDTNVTLTLGGTPATALLQATSLTLGWTGILAPTKGGTGVGTVAVGDLLYGSGIDVWGKLAAGTDAHVLTLVGGVPTWAASSGGGSPAALTRVDDTNVTLALGGTPTTALLQATSLTLGWTGTLAPTRGGTGVGTVAVGDLLYGSGVNVWSKLAAGTNTHVLTLVGGVPTWAAPSGGSSLSLTLNGEATWTPTLISGVLNIPLFGTRIHNTNVNYVIPTTVTDVICVSVTTAFTVTLPAPSTYRGKITVRNAGAGNTTINIAAAGFTGVRLDATVNVTTLAANKWFTAIGGDTNWWVTATNI